MRDKHFEVIWIWSWIFAGFYMFYYLTSPWHWNMELPRNGTLVCAPTYCVVVEDR